MFVFHFDIIVNLNDHNQINFDVDYFNMNNNFTNAFFTKQSIIQQINRTCHYCNKRFYFNNKFHKHLRVRHNQSKLIEQQK